MTEKNHFYRIKTAGPLVEKLAEAIETGLKRSRVLWLLSGGSAIEIAVVCARKLKGLDLSRLTVSLVDERFGDIDHANSNWKRLLDAGFSLPGAALHPWLEGFDLDRTVLNINGFFDLALASDSYKLALLGMGADGHTAGILPNSPATTSESWAVSFSASDYERLTLGFSAIQRLDEAFLYAVGKDKAGELDKLSLEDADPVRQPAQIIKRLPNWWVYNDRMGEEI